MLIIQRWLRMLISAPPCPVVSFPTCLVGRKKWAAFRKQYYGKHQEIPWNIWKGPVRTSVIWAAWIDWTSKCVVGAIVKRDAKRLDVYKEFHSVIVHTFKVFLPHFCFAVKVVDWSLNHFSGHQWSSRWWLGKGPPPARRRSFPIRNVDLKMAWQNYAKEQLQQDSRAPSFSCFDVLGLGHQHR